MTPTHFICAWCGRELTVRGRQQATPCEAHPNAPLYGYSAGDPVPRLIDAKTVPVETLDVAGRTFRVLRDPTAPPGAVFFLNPDAIRHEPAMIEYDGLPPSAVEVEALGFGAMSTAPNGRMRVIVERTDEGNREFSERLLRDLG